MPNRRTTKRDGFTLVELVIAAAITSIILTSIAALFVLALRTVKSGNAAMDANELTRSAFAVLERDLNSAFTSREHGEIFHFHGNEVGMSFIGLVRTYDSAANSDVVQLGRVTYVINPSLNFGSNGVDDDNDGLIDESDEGLNDLVFMERLDTITGEMVEAVLDPSNPTEIGVRTVSLIRYFEPGVETLDEYDPLILQRLDNAISDGFLGIGFIEQSALSVLDSNDVMDAQTIDQARRIYRRDGYIRMLANAAMLDASRNSAFSTSSAWSLLGPDPLNPLDLNPLDYVIVENILDLQSQKLLLDGDTSPYDPSDFQRFPYFLYGEVVTDATGTSTRYSATWNSFDNMFFDTDSDGLPDSLKPYRTVDNDPQLDNRPQLGTPLEARLPEIVRVRLPFIFDSPYAGAPHLQRQLVQDIRIPSAYSRRNPLAGL